jgi:hypothetical protein
MKTAFAEDQGSSQRNTSAAALLASPGKAPARLLSARSG